MHIVLAGNSIFDNHPYVNIGEPDVIHLGSVNKGGENIKKYCLLMNILLII